MNINLSIDIIKRYIFVLISVLYFSTSAHAQNIKFYAQTDAREVFEDSYIEVKFILTNAEGSNFTAPKFEKFDVVSGPNRGSKISIINGARSSKTIFSYTIIPEKSGIFTIEPAKITVNNKTYTSNPITITVKKRSKSLTNSNGKKYFIKTEISDTTAYPGQELILKYVLFTSVEISNYSFRNESDYDGFLAREINTKDQQERIILDNKEYLKATLKSVALFPQKTGNIEITPINIAISVPDGRSRNIFFPSSRTYNVSGQRIFISVKPLPQKPEGASNNVGEFSIKSQLKKKKTSTDDAFPLFLQLEGTGSSKYIEAPDITKSLEKFEIYDPKVVNQKEFIKNNMLYARKTFEYLVVPKEPGTFNIEIDYTYFNTDSSKYITLTTRPGKILVVKGKNSGKTDINKVLAKYKLLPPVKDIKLHKNKKPFFGSIWYWILLLIVFSAIPILYFYKQYLIKQGNLDPTLVRRKKSGKVALKRLKTAKELMLKNKKAEFYKEIEDALLKFVADKFNIPKIDLSKENVRSKLESNGVSNKISTDYIELLKSCEVALYAGNPNEDMKTKLEMAIELITDLDMEI